jgi:hypothetical protein
VGPRVWLDVMETRKISVHCRESNPDFSAVQLVATPTEVSFCTVHRFSDYEVSAQLHIMQGFCSADANVIYIFLVCVSVCLFIYLFIYLSTYLSIPVAPSWSIGHP